MATRADFKRTLLEKGEDPNMIAYYQCKLDQYSREELITLVWKYVSEK